MARDGSGTFNLPEAAFVYDTVIDETAVNSNFSDIAAALTASISKDGQTLPTANLAMGGFKHTGASNATARTDYASAGQVQDSALTECGTAGGTKNAITLSPTPAISAYVSGQKFHFKSGATQSDDAVTIAVSGLPAKAAQIDDAALSATIYIEAGKHYEALYDGTAFQLTRVSVGGLRAANNLSDLASASTARTNLSVYSIAQVDAIATSGATMTITAGEDLADRDLCYLDAFNQRGGGAGKVYKVDAAAIGPVRISKTLCIALSAISSGVTGSAQVADGAISGFTGLISGAPIYASATAGVLTQTVPAIPADGTQIASRLVGFATSTTAIWFDPDPLTTFVKYGAATASGGYLAVESFADSGAAERIARAYLASLGGGFSLIDRTLGTNIGDMTLQGGLAASFDGNTSQSTTQGSAYPSSATTSYIGKDYGSGNTYVVTQGKAYASTDSGFCASNGATVTVTLQASTDNFSSSTVNVSSNAGTDTNSSTITVDASSNSTAYRYWRLKIVTSGAGNNKCAEAQFYISTTARSEPVMVTSETISSAATDRVTAKFVDASDANADTVTTFYNRTNATRAMIAEVTL